MSTNQGKQEISYVVKIEGGYAKQYEARTGRFVRSLCGEAMGAQLSGDTVNITMKDGKVRVYDAKRGTFMRAF